MNVPAHPPPSICVSSIDFERLDALLENAPQTTPGLDALRRELDRADVLEPEQMPGDVITMNATARFRDEASGEERELSLVYPHEVDGSPARVSILAPVGSALLGLRVGQSIDWTLPGGRIARLRVLDVRNLRSE
ncbi:nucleoside diphosphate kinase regulator [Coralloluteibacterium thermophilus]|uniref:Nucleoside diphosphate kinase regulator n=1 Tax=Coralloluteibacterium thermophilum TaxID=2707049 RepID=A0ABV9NPT8_9GAMM